VQLSILGYILVPIFSYGQWWLVLGYALFMIWVSAWEAISRPQQTYRGVFFNTLGTVASCSALVMACAALLTSAPPACRAPGLLPCCKRGPRAALCSSHWTRSAYSPSARPAR
jgi:ABC-type iron transport system FetAB permease component